MLEESFAGSRYNNLANETDTGHNNTWLSWWLVGRPSFAVKQMLN
jgi:hypothetical protein